VTDSDRFGPYTVYERLGAGGMATVHRATIEVEGDEIREVALKRLLPQWAGDKAFVEDFIREAKLAAQLHHPNIVRILELGRIGRTYFIAMDLVEGKPLVSYLRKIGLQKRSIPIPVVVSLASELCDALAHAHEADIVHRDLTPSNLIITESGQLKIIDFGVAKAMSGMLQTSSGLAKGKLGYMSVEAISGRNIDARTDIFSTGVVLWEMLTCRRLFRGDNEYEVIRRIHDGVVSPPSDENPDCPELLDDLVLRALARSPDDRWPSMREMGDALEAVRRHYGRRASAHEVVRWMSSLGRDSSMSVQMRVETEPEPSVMRLSTSDLFETIDQPAEIPEGSRREPPAREITLEAEEPEPPELEIVRSDTYDNDDDDDDDDDDATVFADEPPPPAPAPQAATFRDDPSERGKPERPGKFKEADTVVSVTAFPRKP
jgi:serine/threonine protein kinase